MKHIVSCSFGKDSLAMLLRLLMEQQPIDAVVFYDTGMEFESIYRNRDKVKVMLEKREIPFVELKPEKPFIYQMFVRPVKYQKRKNAKYPYHYGFGWCGGACRWGTSEKTRTIKKYYEQNYDNEEIIEYVGIAADEPKRIKPDPHKRYPLVEWQMSEADCLQYCYDNGFDWNENGVELYSVLDRVSCYCCRNKNLPELRNIYTYLPEYWQRLRGLQTRIDEPMKGPGKSVFELEERFKRELEENHETNGCI